MNEKIIALGDSLTLGYPFNEEKSWVAILREEHALNILNKGINGDTTEGMLERFESDVVKQHPELVIITGGANDAFNFVPVQDMIYNYREMIRIALDNDIVPIIGITLPVDDEFAERKLKKFRIRIWEYCEEHSLHRIDFYSELLDTKTGLIKELYDFDGLHPNPEGYRAMARTAWNVLKCILMYIKQRQL